MVAREIGSGYSCAQAIPTLLFMRRIIIRQQKITRGAAAKLAIFRIFSTIRQKDLECRSAIESAGWKGSPVKSA